MDRRKQEGAPVQHIFSTRLKRDPPPFKNDVYIDVVPAQQRGKIGSTFFTVNITQLISDLPLKTTVLEFKFRRYSTLY